MKILVAGKGGAGKTTVSGTIARALAQAGETVVAVDADVNPMLGISLGVGMKETERLSGVREAQQGGGVEHPDDAESMLATFGITAPDGVRLVVGSRMDAMDPGCPGLGMTPDRLLRELGGDGRIVIGDLEAGSGIVTRMDPGDIDLVLVIANRIDADDDLDGIRAALHEYEIVVLPEDHAIRHADEQGLAPIGVSQNTPGMLVLRELARRLAVRAAIPAVAPG